MKVFKFKFAFLIFLLIFVLTGTVFAMNNFTDGYRVNKGGADLRVNYVNTTNCKIVNNNSGDDLFIPTKTIDEWNKFVTWGGSHNVSFRECCTPNCSGKNCGGDGCGGNCGSCSSSDICSGGRCVYRGYTCTRGRPYTMWHSIITTTSGMRGCGNSSLIGTARCSGNTVEKLHYTSYYELTGEYYDDVINGPDYNCDGCSCIKVQAGPTNSYLGCEYKTSITCSSSLRCYEESANSAYCLRCTSSNCGQYGCPACVPVVPVQRCITKSDTRFRTQTCDSGYTMISGECKNGPSWLPNGEGMPFNNGWTCLYSGQYAVIRCCN